MTASSPDAPAASAITVLVNGAPRALPAGATLAELLAALEVPIEGVAVALNLEVVPRGALAGRALADGDRVEVVRAVGGG